MQPPGISSAPVALRQSRILSNALPFSPFRASASRGDIFEKSKIPPTPPLLRSTARGIGGRGIF